MTRGVTRLVTGVLLRPSVRRSAVLSFSLLPWLIFLPIGLIYVARHGFDGGDTPTSTLSTVTAPFFAVLLIRLIGTAVLSRRRRRPVLIMTAALLLWASGSAVLTTSDTFSVTRFPSLVEGLFLPAYALLAAFLLLDVVRADLRTTSAWLDSLIVLGGTAGLLGSALFTPVSVAFPDGGARLSLLLFYPMLDIVLVSIVVSQVILRLRPRSWPSAMLAAGFLALLVADLMWTGEALQAASATAFSYESNQLSELLFGCGFALLIEASCRPRTHGGHSVVRGRHVIIVAAAATAVAVLVLRPPGAGSLFLTIPAVVTLSAAGVRLVMALKEAREVGEAHRLSLTDDLTGLPNRRAIMADIERGVVGRESLGLVLLGLDGFKEVNDSLGHSAGDAVLCEVGRRLPEHLPASCMVGRLGGDEFAVVVRRDDPDELMGLARRAREALLSPLRVDGMDITLRASAGVTARLTSDGRAADLLRRADVAMSEAKTTRAGAMVYDASRDLFTRERLQLVEQLRSGIAAGQLVVWYQPQVDTHTMQVVGAEALVRWQHPLLGLISPMEFLPIARRSGLMAALTDVVMTRAINDAAAWARAGLDLRVSFNCAPPELLSASMLPKLFKALAAAKLSPERLLVEVTEDSFVADPIQARETLQELRDHHVQTAIDDYGTGFSSLAYLRDLPVHELKIDRSFVSTILADPRSHVIVDSTRQMAHAMGLRLVAEGVEDIETVRALAALDIDLLQGYHIARPMPVEAFLLWLRQWRADHELDLRTVRSEPIM